jgi:hypothetical protein
MQPNSIAWLSLIIGGWAVLNGILHDAQIIIEHKNGYDRELLRLLLNGHIIIVSGLFEAIAFWGLRQNQQWAFVVAGVASLTFFIYCVMIWPFLKSVLTMVLQAGLLVTLVLNFPRSG